MKKTSLILTLCVFGYTLCYSQDNPESIAENFFLYLQEGNHQRAVEALPASTRNETDTSFSARLLTQLDENRASLGKFCGYELIENKEITESYIITEYLVKYLEAPRRIQFVFYRPENNWQVNQVTLNFRDQPATTRNRPQRRL